ncbi:glycosyl transferase, partial [Arthrobacter crystallopoietes BAB-32]
MIPVYNAERYIEETVRSALGQSFAAGQLEVIAVDDGSTDDTAAVLERLGGEDDRLVVVRQENSGGPSKPRNTGLERARGRYVFFLDSDDVLATDSLHRMVEIADREGSDVVLGRFGSLNGRHVPEHMFRETVLDADIIATNAWDSLGPIKLFRRALIQSLGLRFAEDQWIGEDQPFTASMYLNAAKVSVLADRVYCHIRKRDDGQNVTSRQQTLADKAKTTTRLAAVVARYTDPGARRDRLIRRVFTSTLPAALGKLWLTASEEDRRAFVQSAKAGLEPYYTSGVENYCTTVGRIKNHLLMQGETEALRRLAEQEEAGRRICSSIFDGRVVVDLPADVANLVPERLRQGLEVPGVTHKLTDIQSVNDKYLVTGFAGFAGIEDAPSAIRAVLVNRDTDEEVILPTQLIGQRSAGSTRVREFSILTNVLDEVEGPMSPDGAWGIFLDVELEGVARRVRFGKKTDAIHGDKVAVSAQRSDGMRRTIIAYFNAGYKNLTFDVGGVVHKGAVAVAVLGLQHNQYQDSHWLSAFTRVVPAPAKAPKFHRQSGAALAHRQVGVGLFEVIYPLEEGSSEIAVRMSLDDLDHQVTFPDPAWITDERLQFSRDVQGTLSVKLLDSPGNGHFAAGTGEVAEPVNVYWWDGKPNFGDTIGPWLVEMITGRPAINTKGKRHIGNTLVTVGSLLNYLDRGGLEIWGTGLIAPMGEDTVRRLQQRKPRRIHAVRGRKTHEELTRKLGWDVPAVFGDPALLLPRFYSPSTEGGRGHIALVPHYAHKAYFGEQESDDVKVVNVARAPAEVIDDIASASACISTSLHGVIIAQAYGIPWVWLHIADKPLMGDEFKFEDFFSILDTSKVSKTSVNSADVITLDWKLVSAR